VIIYIKLILVIALSDPGESMGYVLSVFFLLAILGATFPPPVTLAPVLITIFVAENMVWRSWMYYAGAGALTALVAYAATDPKHADAAQGGQPGIDIGLSLAAGITGGLIYWWFAGQTAGTACKDKKKQ